MQKRARPFLCRVWAQHIVDRLRDAGLICSPVPNVQIPQTRKKCTRLNDDAAFQFSTSSRQVF